jgi:hypothetical protein
LARRKQPPSLTHLLDWLATHFEALEEKIRELEQENQQLRFEKLKGIAKLTAVLQDAQYVPCKVAVILTAQPKSTISRLCRQGAVRHRNPSGHGRRREVHLRDLIAWIRKRDLGKS